MMKVAISKLARAGLVVFRAIKVITLVAMFAAFLVAIKRIAP